MKTAPCSRKGPQLRARRTLLLAALSLPVASLAQSSSAYSHGFTITGMVKHPGKFTLRRGMRVSDAIVAAGGFLDFATTKKITVHRGEKQYSFNYSTFIRGATEQNIRLENGDEIVVP